MLKVLYVGGARPAVRINSGENVLLAALDTCGDHMLPIKYLYLASVDSLLWKAVSMIRSLADETYASLLVNVH